MDIFSSVVHYLTDKSRGISSKAIFIVFGLVIIVLLDNVFSFSYYYNNSQKISQTKELIEVLKDTSLTTQEKNELTLLRRNIVNHKTIKDISYNYLVNLNFDQNNGNKLIKNEVDKNDSIRNENIHLITSAWWLIIPIFFLLIVFPYVIFTERKEFFNMTLGFIIIISALYLLSLVLSKILSFIPLIDNEPIYNYILNFVLSGLLLLTIILIYRKTQKQLNIEKLLKKRIHFNSIFDLLSFEYQNLPDSSFKIKNTEFNESGIKITNYTKEFKEKVFNLFDELEIKTFENSKGRNFIFSNKYFKPIEINYLKILVNKMQQLYGEDSIKSGLFGEDDIEQLNGDFWLGRSWTDEKHKVPTSISFDKETGLSMTIWLTE